MPPAVPQSEPAVKLPAASSGWFGPLFFWELIRDGRKGTSYFPRVMYASGLLFFLYLTMGNTELTPKRIADLCNTAFVYYLVLQYMVIIILTPAYVAGSIIEDRQNRTLSLLLTTHLTPREIVLGKMMGRLVPMLGVLLAGVPTLAILQLLGGISFEALIFHSVIALMLLLIIGMHSIRAGTIHKTVGGAMMSVYAMLFGLSLLLFPFTWFIFMNSFGIVIWVFLLAGCNFFFACIALHNAILAIGNRDKDQDITQSEMARVEQQQRTVALPVVPPQVVASEEMIVDEEEAKDTPQRVEQFLKSSLVSNRPIIWKEISFPTTELLILTTVLIAGLMFILILGLLADLPKHLDDAQVYFHRGSLFILNLLLFLTTLRAAGTFATERKQQTLVSLLLIPWTWNQIIFEFWLASFWRYRWLGLCGLFVTVTTILFQPLSMFLALPAYLTQLAFLAMLGIACSLVFQTAFQSRLIVSVVLIIGLVAMPWRISFPGSTFLWFIDLLHFPYRTWPVGQLEQLPVDAGYTEQFVITSPFLFGVVAVVNLCIVWGMTFALFRFSRHRLGRWLERGA